MEDSNIKKAGELSEYSPHELLELKKCSENPSHFIENYIKITHPIKGLIPFKMYDSQKRIIKGFVENRFVLNEISRQFGKCVSNNTFITIYKKPNGYRKKVLKILFRKEYNEIFEL